MKCYIGVNYTQTIDFFEICDIEQFINNRYLAVFEGYIRTCSYFINLHHLFNENYYQLICKQEKSIFICLSILTLVLIERLIKA